MKRILLLTATLLIGIGIGAVRPTAEGENWRGQTIWAVPCGYAYYLTPIDLSPIRGPIESATMWDIRRQLPFSGFARTYEDAKRVVNEIHRLDEQARHQPALKH